MLVVYVFKFIVRYGGMERVSFKYTQTYSYIRFLKKIKVYAIGLMLVV
jgi:hypothetical protein